MPHSFHDVETSSPFRPQLLLLDRADPVVVFVFRSPPLLSAHPFPVVSHFLFDSALFTPPFGGPNPIVLFLCS